MELYNIILTSVFAVFCLLSIVAGILFIFGRLRFLYRSITKRLWGTVNERKLRRNYGLYLIFLGVVIGVYGYAYTFIVDAKLRAIISLICCVAVVYSIFMRSKIINDAVE
ncbi:MAG: hypothetical protein LBM07_01640 [Culturomica sp.]|jgi:hypothetical protein|nr:hypothetical protein [Culturomica sp.]